MVNGLVVGRLFKALDRPANGDAGGFELRIPNAIWIATGVQLAQRIYTALHHAAAMIERPMLPGAVELHAHATPPENDLAMTEAV